MPRNSELCLFKFMFQARCAASAVRREAIWTIYAPGGGELALAVRFAVRFAAGLGVTTATVAFATGF